MSEAEGVKNETVPSEKEKVIEKVNEDDKPLVPSSLTSTEKPSLPGDYTPPSKSSADVEEEEPQKETSPPVTNSVRFDDTPQVFEDNSCQDDNDDKDQENGGNETEFDENNVNNDEDNEGHCEVDDEEGDEDFDEEEDEGERSHDSSSAESLVPEMERELGDGQESDKKDKKADQGEDRRDPQYIPKRGVFYEHDDRTLEEDAEVKKDPVREPKKNKAFESVEKWGHDMYDESNQSPKSTEELVDIYGYDIRNEEAPPKARRRRRYGKGPNKYQRSWEDEQAYNKTPVRGGYRGRRVPRNFVQRDEDFPQLPAKHSGNSIVTNSGSNDKGINREALKLGIKFSQTDNMPTKEDIKVRQSGARDKSPAKGDPVERPRGNSSRRGASRGGGRIYTQVSPFGGSGGRSGKSQGGSGHNYNDHPDKRGKEVCSTADEDIATLAQHFSNAVINIDKNIAPIRSQSEPLSDDRAASKEEVTQQPPSSSHTPAQLHNSNAPPNKHHQSSEPLSIKSKRYSNQRHRPQQSMPSGGQVVTSVPLPAQSVPQPQTTPGNQPVMPGAPAPNYLPPQPGYYPPQHGMCPPPPGPPDTSAHMAGPPSQFPPPPGGMQMVTFLPSVPPPANTFQPPPNIFVPSAQYITPPSIVQKGNDAFQLYPFTSHPPPYHHQ